MENLNLIYIICLFQMSLNAYAKQYRTEARGKNNEEFAFISYMDEPNSFSVVSVKRLINVDNLGKGCIREQNKTYRITVERTGKCGLYRFSLKLFLL